MIPEVGTGELKAVVMEVWAEMQAGGFKVPPAATEPAPSAGAAQDDAGAPEEA